MLKSSGLLSQTQTQKALLLFLFAASSVAALAQVSSYEQTTKPALDISTNGGSMSLTKNTEEIPLLIVYDEEIVEIDVTQAIDIKQKQFTAKNLAAIIGVKPRQVKAYRILRGRMLLRYGVTEVSMVYLKLYLLQNIVN